MRARAAAPTAASAVAAARLLLRLVFLPSEREGTSACQRGGCRTLCRCNARRADCVRRGGGGVRRGGVRRGGGGGGGGVRRGGGGGGGGSSRAWRDARRRSSAVRNAEAKTLHRTMLQPLAIGRARDGNGSALRGVRAATTRAVAAGVAVHFARVQPPGDEKGKSMNATKLSFPQKMPRAKRVGTIGSIVITR
jgi:hypothetical protein